MLRTFCDACKGLLKTKSSQCENCGDERHYHKLCLKPVNDNRYCRRHVGDHLENGMIVTYLKNTWRGLNLGGDLIVHGLLDNDQDWSDVTIKFSTWKFYFKATWDSYYKQIRFRISGEPDIQPVNMHNHAGFRKALKELAIAAVNKHLIALRSSVKKHETGIKQDNRDIKKLTFISDVIAGNAQWPAPEVLVPHPNA